MVEDFVHRFLKAGSLDFLSLARVDPGGEFGELVGSELFNGGFDFSNGAHGDGSRYHFFKDSPV